MNKDELSLLYGNGETTEETPVGARSAFDQLKYCDNRIQFSSNQNTCEDCGCPLVATLGCYSCPECGQIQENCVDLCKSYDTGGYIRFSTGANAGKCFSMTEYAKIQLKILNEQLSKFNSIYKGIPFAANILQVAATQYNEIQKNVKEDVIDANGNIIGKKKFVRRSNIKDEILAALIYYAGVQGGITRKKKDVAELMQLATAGFSRGEDTLRKIDATNPGIITISLNCDPIEGYVERYMEKLGIMDSNYHDFVVEFTRATEREHIGMSSQLPSKIVGAIWMLKCHKDLKFTAQQLEEAADGTKKHTFMRAYKLMLVKRPSLDEIFIKYLGVPMKA